MRVVLPVLLGLCLGCSDELPDEVAGYADCILMNREPHPPREDDPHAGNKNVYACGIELETLTLRAISDPYPDTTLIVKESTKLTQDYPWLIATMEKVAGAWRWAEYTRNFPDEPFLQIPVSEATCIDCHAAVEGADFVYQVFDP